MGWDLLHTCIARYRVSVPAFDTRGRRWRWILTPAFTQVEKPKTQVSHSAWMLFRSRALQFIIQIFSSTNSRFLASTKHVSYCWWIASLCTLVAMLFVFLCAYEAWFRVARCASLCSSFLILKPSCFHLIIPCNLRDFLYFLLDCNYIQVIFVLFDSLFLNWKIGL